MEEFVVLVDHQDQELGLMEKQQAHVAGLLHRAFSVFIFNSNGELMLQQRAASKYHSPTLWTNTCCSHPRENESYVEAVTVDINSGKLANKSCTNQRVVYLKSKDVPTESCSTFDLPSRAVSIKSIHTCLEAAISA